MSRIVVVGGVNMDIHLFGVRPPAATPTHVAERHHTEPGGKGANVARAVVRLGGDVRLVARVGDDDFGRACRAAIEADGVDTRSVLVTPGAPTGFVAIELSGGHHRSLVFSSGANDELAWDDVLPALEDVGDGDVVVAQAEIPPATVAALADWTTQRQVPFFLDPTPPAWVDRDLLAAADVVTPDRAEAAALTGRVDTSELWPVLAAQELRALGVPTVIVKTGASGAVLSTGDDLLLHVPTLAVDPVDETGAGDVFLAALAVRRSDGADWAEAVLFANAASALSVAHRGLLLPDRASVAAAVARLAAPAPIRHG